MTRVVVNTFGSWGDLFPLIPIAAELRARGHDVCFAVPAGFVDVLTKEGFECRTVGERLTVADHVDHADRYDARPRDPLALRRLWQSFVLAELPEVVDGLREACRDADVLIAHPSQQAAPIVSESMRLPWITASMLLGMIPSRYTVPQGFLRRPLRTAPGRWVNAGLWAIGKASLSLLLDGPTNRARRRAGVAPTRGTIFEALSPQLCLWLSSPVYQPRPPDWPGHVRMTGFTYFDAPKAWAEPPELEEFVRRDNSPLVLFTLGFSAGMNPGDSFESARGALRHIGARGVLLGGWPGNLPQLPDDALFACDYAAMSKVLPHASAVVHAGGYGTTVQSLRSGVPQVVVPWGFDQIFHGDAVRALGVGRVLPRRRLKQHRLAKVIEGVLTDPKVPSTAADVGERLRAEGDGARRAADEIEAFVRTAGPE